MDARLANHLPVMPHIHLSTYTVTRTPTTRFQAQLARLPALQAQPRKTPDLVPWISPEVAVPQGKQRSPGRAGPVHEAARMQTLIILAASQ